MQRRIQIVHMVGIGGSGMSGIAEVLLNLGYTVHGSDLQESPAVKRLRDLGAHISIGHTKENVLSAHVLVKSTAVGADNPEVIAAKEQGIPIIPRAEMLAELMRLRTGLSVAGCHGKTTTTSLLASIFHEADLDPTVIIGGKLNAYGANAHLGTGRFFIAEADESDGSFLCLFSIMNIVTNIDLDHVDHYSDLESIENAFVQFMNKVPFYGVNVVCGDDPSIQRILHKVNRPVTTYGFGEHNDLTAEIISIGEMSRFTVSLYGNPLGEVNLAQPGQHNILNALGAIGLALSADISFENCVAGLEKFTGVGRRFEKKGERNGVLVIDDYGHHPAEIKVVLQTARQCYPNRRLIAAFQPHRFSRTKALFGDFCTAFEGVDRVLLTEIYAASETPLPGISGDSLAHGIRQVSQVQVNFCPDFAAIHEKLDEILQPGDVLITLGAGSIHTVGQKWLEG